MIVRSSIATLLLVVGLCLITIQFWVPLFIYRPTALERTDPASWGLRGAVFIRVPYSDGTAITGWWSPPLRANGPVVLLVHGRSGNISSRSSVMRRLAQQGMGVLLFDYRGYGASTGRPSERHLTDDTLAAYRWVRRQGISASHIVVVGQSLGNSPATALAAQQPVGGLLLISPFTNLPDALAERLPWLSVRLIPWSRNRFDVATSLRRVLAASVLVASENDGLVPIQNARQLRNARDQQAWIDASPLQHNGMLQALAEDGRLGGAIRALIPAGAAAER